HLAIPLGQAAGETASALNTATGGIIPKVFGALTGAAKWIADKTTPQYAKDTAAQLSTAVQNNPIVKGMASDPNVQAGLNAVGGATSLLGVEAGLGGGVGTAADIGATRAASAATNAPTTLPKLTGKITQ